MKEALYYRKLKDKKVQCNLCPHFCVIENGEVGKCRVRQNVDGRLMSLVYGRPCSIAIDPIEKKPFYHFMPGQTALGIATAGCNFSCLNCQNADISQAEPENVPSQKISALEVIHKAKKFDTKIISYTYTEPTIFYEYMFDIARLARKQKIKNTAVTNGFINELPLKKICKLLDGINVDLKSIDDKFYKKVCGGRVNPVLESLKIIKQEGVWMEITNLIIPGLNDDLYSIRKLISWIINNLGYDVPIHFTAFFPTYKLLNTSPTPMNILKKARKIALNAGANYVYTGNIHDDEGNNTYCPNCKKPIIIRDGYKVVQNKLKKGKCGCGGTVAGVWR